MAMLLKNTVMKNRIGKNGLPMTDWIGQQHSLVGKWPMADRYIVLCNPWLLISICPPSLLSLLVLTRGAKF